ncbi:MAG: aspartate aminotransferase family protein [Pseudomonadota bacterium]|nr:aspartate aminotransferase family protein [Pseudomonadota bacterium]
MPSVLPVYRRSNITITRGEGAYLFAEDGTRYLDFAAGIAVNALGHCHPQVVAALKKQADVLWHCSNMYRMPGLERLADRLTEATFADKVFFCNSGAEAVECGLKMIRKYFSTFPWSGEVAESSDAGGSIPAPAIPPPGGGGRYRIITVEGGFHGRTLACISAGGNDIARRGYAPLMDGFDRVEFNNLKAVEAAITPETAAILAEPIQGEGGIRETSIEFLRGLRALCDGHGLLLFLDEVQCGMGRTGALFAHEQAGITPDIVSVAKGIGNGFPLAACLATDRAASGMTPGSHGSTYGSNPLAMAVGNAVLDVMLAPGFFARVEKIGAALKAGLEELAQDFPALIAEVRGRGLMLGLKTRVPPLDMVEKWRAAKLLAAPAEDNVIRITPPLIITETHVQEALRIMRNICEAA